MKIVILFLSAFCLAQDESVDMGTQTNNGFYLQHWSSNYRAGSPDLISSELDYEYQIMESKSSGESVPNWRALRKTNRELNFKIWKYNRFIDKRRKINQVNNDDIKGFLAKGNAATSRAMDETTLGFHIRTKRVQADIKGEGLELLKTLKKDLKSLKSTPDLPDKFKLTIDSQIDDIDRQEKEWRERKWYGPSALTPEKIDKLQKELLSTSLKARAINTLWETHQKNLKAEIEAAIKANNEAKSRLNLYYSSKIRRGQATAGSNITIRGREVAGDDQSTLDNDQNQEVIRRIERKTQDFNLILDNVSRNGDLANLDADFMLRNLNDWARKIAVDVSVIQKGLRTNDDFIASMKNTPLGVFVDVQIAKAFEGLCEKVRACMVNDPQYLLKESLKGVNDSSRIGKEPMLGPVQTEEFKAPIVREK